MSTSLLINIFINSHLKFNHFKKTFSDIYNIFEDEESKQKGIYCIKFGNEDIKRSEILKYIVYKIERNI